jgi:hypothetical protein
MVFMTIPRCGLRPSRSAARYGRLDASGPGQFQQIHAGFAPLRETRGLTGRRLPAQYPSRPRAALPRRPGARCLEAYCIASLYTPAVGTFPARHTRVPQRSGSAATKPESWYFLAGGVSDGTLR